MKENQSRKFAFWVPSIGFLGFTSFVFFLASIVFSTFNPTSPGGEYLSLVFHLLAFFIVPRLPAPDWAKAAGYFWLGLDVTVGIMSLNGVDHAITHPVRLGGHVFAAIWIVAASRNGDATLRLIGLMTGICLFGYSLIAPFVPAYLLYPAAILVMAWFCAIGLKSGTIRNGG